MKVSAPKARQRGVVTLIAAVLFLVIVGYAALTALQRGTSGMFDEHVIRQHHEARFLAESALERAAFNFRNGVACASLPEGPIGFGSGTFTITSASTEGSNCRVTATGEIALVQASASSVVSPAGGSGGYTFVEPFPDAADFASNWVTEVLFANEGSSGFSGDNCPSSLCLGSLGGSFVVQTHAASQREVYEGYRERPIPVIDTSGGAVTTSFSLAFKKYADNNKASKQDVSVSLYSSTGQGNNREIRLWFDGATGGDNTWSVVTGAVTLPAGFQYDTLRVDYSLREFKFNQAFIWIDEVQLTTP